MSNEVCNDINLNKDFYVCSFFLVSKSLFLVILIGFVINFLRFSELKYKEID